MSGLGTRVDLLATVGEELDAMAEGLGGATAFEIETKAALLRFAAVLDRDPYLAHARRLAAIFRGAATLRARGSLHVIGGSKRRPRCCGRRTTTRGP